MKLHRYIYTLVLKIKHDIQNYNFHYDIKFNFSYKYILELMKSKRDRFIE
jgi:hypothetical protein